MSTTGASPRLDGGPSPPAPWSSVLSGFLAFLLAAGLAGPLSPALTRILLLLVLAAIVVPVARRSGAPRAARVALLSMPAWPLLAARLPGATPTIDVLIVVATLAASARISDSPAVASVRMLGAQALGLAALLFVAVRHLPIVWSGLDGGALAISRIAGVLSGAPVELGPTFAGVWVVLLFAALGATCLIAASARTPATATRVAALLVLTVVATVVYAAAMPSIEAWLRAAAQALITPPTVHIADPDQPARLAPGAMASLGNVLLLLALWLPTRWLLLPLRPEPPGRARPLWLRAFAALAVFLGGAGLMARSAPITPAGATIAFYDDGTLDFSSPQPGRYGLIQAGMYGGSRQFLELAGYPVANITRAEIEAGLDDVDALVVINLREPFSDHERARIWDFVRAGGGLLVMGDHTDLFGIMKPLNHLLEPIGTEFIFDSAFPLRSHWQYTLEVRPHPITLGMVDHHDFQIGTGGSLVLRDPATRPVVIGRYAFSDFGNRLNDGQGGLLGDYRYQIGERLGDVALVAAAEVGDGRVVVFGDTSSFQVLAIAQSRAFLDRVFAYVAGGDRAWPASVGAAFWALLVIGLAGLLWRRQPSGTIVPLALLLLAADAAGELLPRPDQSSPVPPNALALVDASHVPQAPFEFFVDGSIAGLFTSLYRAGYLPTLGRLDRREDLDQLGLVVIFAPAEPYTPAEVETLARHLARGGTLLIVADGRAPDLVEAPLSLCGLTIESLPLGPARVPWNDDELEMVDAWPLTATGDLPTVIHAAWEGYGLIAETRPGPGRCLAIGDRRFFYDSNFEGEREFHAVNVPFVDALLSDGTEP